MIFLFCLVFFFVSFAESARNAVEEPIDYNVEIDLTLSGIENAVRNQNETDFSAFFSDSFDSNDWYRKFMQKLTAEQAATYSLSRFGDVKDGKSFQFTESVRFNETTTRLIPFDADFLEIASENRKKMVIDSLKVHDVSESDVE